VLPPNSPPTRSPRIHPIVVGIGAKLFDGDTGTVPLKLVSSRTFSTGVMCCVYAPAEASDTMWPASDRMPSALRQSVPLHATARGGKP
jgi:hypothetical protein